MHPDWCERLGRIRFIKRPYAGAINVSLPGYRIIDVTSRATGAYRAFSPFVIGPVSVPGFGQALKMENAWQFSKVYAEHIGPDGEPNALWQEWAREGYLSGRAQRYPRGRGARPEYLYWGGRRLDYTGAKKQVYLPLYRDAVAQKPVFRSLSRRLGRGEHLAILDFDVYDLDASATTFHEALSAEDRSTGHGFILGMMLVYGADVDAHRVAKYHEQESIRRRALLSPAQDDLFRP